MSSQPERPPAPEPSMNTINQGELVVPQAQSAARAKSAAAAQARALALSPTEDPVTAAILEVLDRMSKHGTRTKGMRAPQTGDSNKR